MEKLLLLQQRVLQRDVEFSIRKNIWTLMSIALRSF